MISRLLIGWIKQMAACDWSMSMSGEVSTACAPAAEDLAGWVPRP